MNADAFEALSVGSEAELVHVISDEDVRSFARLSGDDNPLHMDDGYARAAGAERRVVHGMLTASFLSAVIGTRLPGPGSLWFEQNLRFLLPVRIGERITVKVRVRHKSVSQRVLALDTYVYGEGGVVKVEGEGKVKVLRAASS